LDPYTHLKWRGSGITHPSLSGIPLRRYSGLLRASKFNLKIAFYTKIRRRTFRSIAKYKLPTIPIVGVNSIKDNKTLGGDKHAVIEIIIIHRSYSYDRWIIIPQGVRCIIKPFIRMKPVNRIYFLINLRAIYNIVFLAKFRERLSFKE